MTTRTILQIIPNMGAGGAEQAVVDVAAALVARGDRALVVSQGGARVPELEEADATHIVQTVASKNPIKILKNALWLARLVRREKVDLVHARSRAPAWSAHIAVKLTRTPFVTTFHAAYKFKSDLKRAYNAVMTKADRVIAISQFIAAHIKESYAIDPEKIRVVPRGIDLTRFSPEAISEARKDKLRKTWGIPENARVILLPARLSPIKGHGLAIEAMARLQEVRLDNARFGGDCSDALLVIMGDDQGRVSYRATLEQLVVARKLKDQVLLVPHSRDMPAAYALADLVLVPSRVPEGFGRVPVEAMAMGVPVIASDLGATRETVVNNQTGWLLPPDDPDQWATAIKRALSLPPEVWRAMVDGAMARARQFYDEKHMVAETLAVYDELLDEKMQKQGREEVGA